METAKGKIPIGFLIATFFCCYSSSWAQIFPSQEENFPFIVTLGASALGVEGDEDHEQVYFFTVHETQSHAFYFRIYDPECGGLHDEEHEGFESKFKFSLYGGKNVLPKEYHRQPKADSHTGDLLTSQEFSNDEEWDGKWYTMGPFSLNQGEYHPKYNGYIFKMVVEGLEGNDGNAYRFAVSNSKKHNVPLKIANGFAFDYSFRMADMGTISHLYPFVPKDVMGIHQKNFDWDDDGWVRMISKSKKDGETITLSSNGTWASSRHLIKPSEWETSLDLQLIKCTPLENNNVVIRLEDLYGNALPIFSTPVGQLPVNAYQIGHR